MTQFVFNAEGLTEGQDVTTSVQGGAGSGTVMDAWARSGAPVIKGLAAAAKRGARGLRIIAGDSDSIIGTKNLPAGVRSVSGSFLIDLDAANAYAANQVWQVRNSVGILVAVQLQGANRLVVAAGTAAAFTGRTFTNPLPTKAANPGASIVRVDWWVKVHPTAPSASNGVVEVAYFIGKDNTTPAESVFAISNADLGTVDLVSLRNGKLSTGTGSALTLDLDTIAWTTNATARYASPASETVANQAPEVTLATDPPGSLEPFSTVTIQGTGTDPDGTVASYAWRVIGTTGGLTAVTGDLVGSGSSRTLVLPGSVAGGTITVGVIPTDNDGLAGTEGTLTMTVLPVSERAPATTMVAVAMYLATS